MIDKNKINLVLGDAYEKIKTIPDKSIDLIITDPPYDISFKKPNKIKPNNRITLSCQQVCQELYNAKITKGIDLLILDEFVRIMKKINIYIWCNRKQILPYLEYFVKEKNCKFDILVWIKSNPVPTCGKNYLNDKEYCLFFRNGVELSTTYNTGHTYWITPTNKQDKKMYDHPTIKPLFIIETMLLNSSKEGDIIFDPFSGSGTTGVAAVQNNRDFVGIEINEKYYEVSKKRISMAKNRKEVIN